MKYLDWVINKPKYILTGTSSMHLTTFSKWTGDQMKRIGLTNITNFNKTA